jgi:radical SAM superfamily enzyme YgiQ (UPF0313 family)
MRICLISALSRLDARLPDNGLADFNDAPLGVLTLAAILERERIPVELMDLDWEFARHRMAGGCEVEFGNRVAAQLAASACSIFGFSTLCQSWPLTLAIARRLKDLRSDAYVIVGGPQASVVDVAAVREFPQIDVIVRGEADETLPLLIEAIAGGGTGLDLLPGLTYRSAGRLHRTSDAPPYTRLDELPLPAYHLYPGVQRARRMVLEAGRGCPFACSFCSTNDFFRRKFRLKSPHVVLEQMRQLEALFGARSFSLVHDMFTVDRRRVAEFCETFIGAGRRYRWSCSARTDCVDDALLALMAKARCTGVFFGIETGSPSLQRTISKGLVLSRAQGVVRAAGKNGIGTTVSLITGFPEETAMDFRDTVSFMLEAARGDSVVVQLHLLSPLSGTPLEASYRGALKIDDTASDISTPMKLPAEVRLWIETYPEIFSSFYHIPMRHLEREYLAGARSFLLRGLRRARWLMLALHQIYGHILDVFEGWRTTRPGKTSGIQDFLRYVEGEYGAHPAVAALLRFYGLLSSEIPQHQLGKPRSGGENRVPVLSAGTEILDLPFSLTSLLERIREGKAKEYFGSRPETVAVTKRKVIALHPLQAGLVSLCDGHRDLEGIVQSLDPSLWEFVPGIEPEQASQVVLEELAKEGVVSWDWAAGASREAAARAP